MNTITAGDKVGTLLACRMVKSIKTGNVAVEASFSFKEGDKTETLEWQGWTSPAAIANTKRTLTNVLGWNGSDAVDDDKVFTDPKAFAYGREVKIEVEISENTGDDGKVYQNAKIAWVRPLRSSAFQMPEKGETVSAFGALKSEGSKPGVSTSNAKVAGKKPLAKAATAAPPPFDEDEELPF